jgi:glycosyltransferase involved in cell wall biosynthesis
MFMLCFFAPLLQNNIFDIDPKDSFNLGMMTGLRLRHVQGSHNKLRAGIMVSSMVVVLQLQRNLRQRISVRDAPTTSQKLLHPDYFSPKTPTESFVEYVDTAAIDVANSVAGRDAAQWAYNVNLFLQQFNQTPVAVMETSAQDGDDTWVNRLAFVGADRLQGTVHGPLVSVIMTAWNAEATVRSSALSILRQSWSPIELLIVDDASTDDTWSVMYDIAAAHGNVQVMKNVVSVGTYASKNMALLKARGEYVTCQDADDLSHPQRIELQMRPMMESYGAVKGTHTLLMKLERNGAIERCRIRDMHREFDWSCMDSVLRTAYMTPLLNKKWMLRTLGSWDSVLYSADGEIMHRAGTMLGTAGFQLVYAVGVLLLDRKDSLSKHGVHDGSRKMYKEWYKKWHDRAFSTQRVYVRFPPKENERPFPIPDKMAVSPGDICTNMKANGLRCR